MSRRRIARMLGAASLLALLPLAATSAAPAAPDAGFSAPAGPLILTRTLRRPLADGAEIVSTRRYEVRIVPDGDGFRVDGALLQADVVAPPALAALAEIERKRPDGDLFPFRLDRNGMIASNAAPSDARSRAAAAIAAKAAVATSTLGETDRREAGAVIERLLSGQGAVGARWPGDLFHPTPGVRSQTSQVDLGAGQTGSVTTTVEARRGETSTSIERTVVTETGGARRATYETYTVSRREG